MHIHTYTCMYMCVCVCVCEREERGVVLGGSVGGWVGEYVLVRVCVVCADSSRLLKMNRFIR